VKIKDKNSANMLFVTDGNLHYEHIPPTKRSTKHTIFKFLNVYCSAFIKESKFWMDKWILHQDNMPPHRELSLSDIWPKVPMLEYPLYLPI
jgi:hypothetical protein